MKLSLKNSVLLTLIVIAFIIPAATFAFSVDGKPHNVPVPPHGWNPTTASQTYANLQEKLAEAQAAGDTALVTSLQSDINYVGAILNDLTPWTLAENAYNNETDPTKLGEAHRALAGFSQDSRLSALDKLYLQRTLLGLAGKKMQLEGGDAAQIAENGRLMDRYLEMIRKAEAIEDATKGAEATSCWTWTGGFHFYNCVLNLTAVIGSVVVWTVSWILAIANQAFNLSIFYSVQKFNEIVNSPAVENAWVVCRDLVNLSLIFILMYAAFGLILNLSKVNGKKMVTDVVVIALLVNFSAFFVGIAIDASNIIANQFYQTAGQGQKTVGEAPDISTQLVQGFMGSIKTNFDPKTQEPAEYKGPLTFWSIIISTFGQSILILITSLVLFAGALMFLIRAIKLLFILILSPLAFLGLRLGGKAGGLAGKWMGALSDNLLFAPAFLFMLLLTIQFNKSGVLNNVVKGAKPLQAASGAQAFGFHDIVPTLIYFTIINGMMIGCLLIAKSFSIAGLQTGMMLGGKINRGFLNLGKRVTGGATRFGARNIDRATGGRISGTLRNIRTRVSGAAGRATGWAPVARVGQVAGTAASAVQEDFGLTGSGRRVREAVSHPLNSMNNLLGKVTKPTGVEVAPLGRTKDQEKELEKLRKEEKEAQEKADRLENENRLRDAARRGDTATIKDILKKVSPKQIGNMDVKVIMNVAPHLGGGHMKAISENKDLTPEEQRQIKEANIKPLVDALARSKSSDAATKAAAIKTIEDELGRRKSQDIAKLNESILLDPEIIKRMTPDVLAESVKELNRATANTIRTEIDKAVKAGTATTQQIASQEWLEKDFVGKHFGH